MTPADRIKNLKESETSKIFSEVKNLTSKGEKIINLSAGESDLPTPDYIKNAAIKAIRNNLTKYTPNSGSTELLRAVSLRLKKDHNLDYTSSEIIVSSGAKQSLFNAVLSVINENDEVIIPSPYWVSYPEMVKFSQGKPVIIQTSPETQFKINARHLSSAITDKTKALILCNPSNPAGSVYTRDELSELAEICIQHNLYVISDEIYEKLVYDDIVFHSFAGIQNMKERTILINGVSKSYNMTGWRIGFAAAPSEIISSMNIIQSHSTSCAGSVSQAAAAEALNRNNDFTDLNRSEFQKRRDFFYDKISGIRGIKVSKPAGAFYLFPDISSFFGRKAGSMEIRNSFDLSFFLLRNAGVAVVPGSAFGAEGYIRISFTASIKTLEKAAEQIKNVLYEFD